MLFEALVDLGQLALFVAGTAWVFGFYVRHRQPLWSEHLAPRRVALVSLFALVVGAIKVTEEVLDKETGPVDEAVLRFVHATVPATWGWFFEAVTGAGSATVLVPIALAAALGLLATRHRIEALLLAASAVIAPAVVYLIKTAVGRERPSLWETQWYWGSSFPSGHTLSSTAVALAAALCVARLAPRWGRTALWLAIVWGVLVAMSRLVLGVHWPSDVLAALCIGAFIPIALGVALDTHRGRHP